ncbi:calcium-binding protein [Pseudooceanicola sediminis]|mgnify:CR=1 FL=1|uniref:Calcium-binding protein n=1 Tax=Pseudooceanicola sediminis TaxID=2211117 RepID=A0A399J1N4_9RHOB|nr:Hint domain-containing protein [Pseudooceanicola sediminis]KAA2313609.1 Hint domain-containing protein [Puniceibacterium sp. HSS470]RII38547.1 calcium-binding protein [Pseudooceanicola sediminis]|tara:strand:- start:916 stop:1995 length:1080 start_codon:yes stop_codon:yes gene_type:complete
MPVLFQAFKTVVSSGIASSDSQLVTIALYGPAETINTSDGADLRIVDTDGDGLISPKEFRDSVGGGGLGLDTGGGQLLFDGQPPASANNGTLYSPAPVGGGADVNSYIDTLEKNFPAVEPTEIETSNPDQVPGTDPTDSTPVCFARGTLIQTSTGARRVETLRVGDLLTTQDHGDQPIRWIGGWVLHPQTLVTRPRLAPIRIDAGALGKGLPRRPLIVSPQHRMLVRSPIARRMFGAAEVLIPARLLTDLPGITHCLPGTLPDQGTRPLDYFHLLLDRHEVIFAEGAPSETFYTGPFALENIGRAGRDTVSALLTRHTGHPAHRVSARPLVKGRQARQMIARHASNAKPLLGLATPQPA